jgi:hypothetical protein
MLLIAVGGICILGCSASRQESSNDYRAWIAIETDASGIKVDAYCFNETSQDAVLRYELKAKKTGKAGKAQTSQSGSVEVAGGQQKRLSRLDLSVSAQDRYQIDLKVYKDVELVAEDSISYPQQQ